MSRVDPHTNKVIATVGVAEHPGGTASGGGSVWVASYSGVVTRIDPSGKVIATVDVAQDPESLAFGDGSLWVASPQSNVVTEIDPKTNTAARTVAFDDPPGVVVVADGAGGS